MATRTSERDYDALRARSGWHAAAWRDFRRLSQQELADEVQTSKSHVSDMERGEKPWSSHWLQEFSRALRVRPGHLIDLDPFKADPEAEAFVADFTRLDQRGREMVLSTLRTAMTTVPDAA
ncbi:MAG: helix-turn-helix transcriptional regulator [Brevundimonas sp.]|nr:helix-turn-helix transcriptional regulator [Brevundimonas sp.]